jgi:hypothetical protein
MPVLGMTQDSGVLVRWLVASGQQVVAGTPLMEVETDKAVVEIDAPATGVLGDISLAEGQSAAVGTVIARIFDPSEASTTTGQRDLEAAPSRDVPIASGPAPGAGAIDDAAVVDDRSPASPTAARAFVRSSPLARRLAAELGVDLVALSGRGMGPGGAVVAADVVATARAPGASGAPGSSTQVRARAPSPEERAETGPNAHGARVERDPVMLSADVELDALRRLAGRLEGAVTPAPRTHDLLVMLALVALEHHLDGRARVAVRRSGDGIDRRSVWAGERPVLGWLAGIGDVEADQDGDVDPATADALLLDATSSRLRRRGGLGSHQLVVALGARPGTTVAVDVTVDVRDTVLAERFVTDLVTVAEDPALAPFLWHVAGPPRG